MPRSRSGVKGKTEEITVSLRRLLLRGNWYPTAKSDIAIKPGTLYDITDIQNEDGASN